MRQILMTLILTAGVSIRVHAKDNEVPFLALGQGIAVPANTSPINYSHGFTYTNSAVAADYSGIQLSLEYDTANSEDSDNGNNPAHLINDNNSGNNSGAGVELAVGTGSVGLGLGHYKNDCDNCEGKTGAIAGFSTSSFSFGLGFHEDDTYSAGLIAGTTGAHRFGAAVDWHQGPDNDDDIRSYGIGYGYIGDSFIISIDASKKENEIKNDSDKIILLTPALEVTTDSLALSVSHDTYLNDSTETHDDQTWFGAGFNFKSGVFNVYHDYVKEWAFVLALRF